MATETKPTAPLGKDHTYTPTDAELYAAITEYANTTDPGVVYQKFPWLRYFHPRCYKSKVFFQREVDAIVAEFGYDTDPATVYAKYPHWRFHYPPPRQAQPAPNVPQPVGAPAAPPVALAEQPPVEVKAGSVAQAEPAEAEAPAATEKAEGT